MFSEARSKGSAAQLQVEPFGLCLTYVGQPANKPEHLHAIADFLLVVRHVHSLSLVSEGGLCQYDWVSEDRVERSLRIVPDCAPFAVSGLLCGFLPFPIPSRLSVLKNIVVRSSGPLSHLGGSEL